MYRPLILVLFQILFSPLSAAASELVTYCEVDKDPTFSERVFFDIDRLVAYASDTSSSLEPIQEGAYVGFLNPFPIMVPTESAMKASNQVVWNVDGYSFDARPVFLSSQWIIVHARPSPGSIQEQNTSRRSITVLYSYKIGLLAFEIITQLEQQELSAEFLLCSKQGLRIPELVKRLHKRRP